eukprot:909371-Pyramimonas_sp.AAC.1
MLPRLQRSPAIATDISECRVYSDCSDVVQTAAKGNQFQLSPKKMYAGAVLQCHGQRSSVSERWRRLGNHHADTGAEHAALLHPHDEAQMQAAGRLVKFARGAPTVAAHVMFNGRDLDLSGVERSPNPVAGKALPIGHD